MTMRSKQWYTNTSRLPNSFVNVSIGRPPLIESRQQDHRSDGRWSQNFKYVWLEFCKEKDVVFLAFAPLGHGIRPGPLEDPVISAIAARVGKTPAQVLLAWGVQRGTALLTTPRTAARARENLNISALPEGALDEINRIQTRQRFNEVVKTGSPGFIKGNRFSADYWFSCVP